ncbi:MAG: plastocyanin/azurin family copper-binding protein [Acidimicrobiales bacterium]
MVSGRVRVVLGIAAVALVAAGCGASDSSAPPTTLGPGGYSLATTVPATTTPSASPTTVAGGVTDITVGETEYKLTMSSSFTAGRYKFKAVDNGQIVHALQIVGPGVNATTRDLLPGESADLTVTLQPGKYDFFCPIPGHKQLGMNQEVTVTAAGGAGG